MVFAVDSVGGLLAAGYYFLLGHAAPHLGLSWFGLSMFAGVAVGLAVYSGICFLRGGRHWRGLLRLLIIGNGAHGLATVVWVGLQWREVTGWGIAAMTWDWIILSGVIAWECRMLSILSQTSTHGRTKSAG
jgi:hypothetical protein